MADAWLPGAGRLHIEEEDGGNMKGGAPRAVWHVTGTDPRLVSGRSAAQILAEDGRSAHLVWNPLTGEIMQIAPATRAARILECAAIHEGRVCIQILVVGLPSEPFTSGPLYGLDSIMTWLDSWQIARQWPAGPPLRSPQAYHSPQNRRIWARGGYYGAAQMPAANTSGPGAIDIYRITGPHTAIPEIPRPRMASALPEVRQSGAQQPGPHGERESRPEHAARPAPDHTAEPSVAHLEPPAAHPAEHAIARTAGSRA